MGKIKGFTHVFAAAVGAVAAFFATPAGMALLHQYPHAAPIIMGIIAVGGIYHNPNTGGITQ